MKFFRFVLCLPVLLLASICPGDSSSQLTLAETSARPPAIMDVVTVFADKMLVHARVPDNEGRATPLFLDQVDVWTNSSPRPGQGVWPQGSREKKAGENARPEFYDHDFVCLLDALQRLLPADYGARDKRVEHNLYANAARACQKAWPDAAFEGNARTKNARSVRADPAMANAERLAGETPQARYQAGQIASVIEFFCQRHEALFASSGAWESPPLESARPWVELALKRYFVNGYIVSGPTPDQEPECDPWRVSSGRSGCSRLALALLHYELLNAGRDIAGVIK